MDNFIASKNALNKAKLIFHKMQKYSSKSCDRIEQYQGKQYEVGQLVYPKELENVYDSFVVNTISTYYHKGWKEGDAFIVSEKRVKPEYSWRVTDKASGTSEKVLIYIPIYDLVKLDDPAIEIRGSRPNSFTVLS